MSLFIALEGPHGVGKARLAAELSQSLGDVGLTAVNVSDPGTTDLGHELREMLLTRVDVEANAEAQALMFLAAKVQLWEEVVGPALDADQVVIADRWHLSTLVHQGMLLGDQDIRGLISRVLGNRRPDLNIVLIGEQKDHIEDSRFEKNLEVGYMNYCYNCVEGSAADLIYRYDTSIKSMNSIAESVFSIVMQKLET